MIFEAPERVLVPSTNSIFHLAQQFLKYSKKNYLQKILFFEILILKNFLKIKKRQILKQLNLRKNIIKKERLS